MLGDTILVKNKKCIQGDSDMSFVSIFHKGYFCGVEDISSYFPGIRIVLMEKRISTALKIFHNPIKAVDWHYVEWVQ